ncbi:MAG: NAD(P)H-quinone oxidoreductase [Gammaproteobacteria bacterium]|nr:NAD(P)H-quinone oxidoreductase [Gammaproteobacteria bacterium]
MTNILVLYYSNNGATESLARQVCTGVDSIENAAAVLRTVPSVSTVCESTEKLIPSNGPPYVNKKDLANCSGLIMGSPTYFGNMAAPLKYFLDSTSSEWLSGVLAGKPAGFFTSSSSSHGGQESTLLSMAIPLLHHGMIIVGIPYTLKEISTTKSGGGPYGASHITWNRDNEELTNEEKKVAQAVGKRVTQIAKKLILK